MSTTLSTVIGKFQPDPGTDSITGLPSPPRWSQIKGTVHLHISTCTNRATTADKPFNFSEIATPDEDLAAAYLPGKAELVSTEDQRHRRGHTPHAASARSRHAPPFYRSASAAFSDASGEVPLWRRRKTSLAGTGRAY